MAFSALLDMSVLSALVKTLPSFIYSPQVAGEACTHQMNPQNGEEKAGNVFLFFFLNYYYSPKPQK